MADRSVTYEFKAKVDNLSTGLATAGKSVQEFGKKLTALDANGQKMRAGLTSIGSAAGKMGLVAAGGLGVIIAKSANFEQAMSNVAAATGETTANLNQLREAAIEAGAKTAFSATEAADGIEQLSKAGVSTADILGGGLAGALDLAAAGEMQVGAAAEAAASALTQFKLSGEDVPHVADLLAAGAGKAQGEVSDLSMALSQSGLVASQMGLSIEETVGALTAFSSAGLMGSDAGTSFKTMLMRLTPDSKKAAEQMKELGINAFDANGEFIGLTKFAGQLQNAMKDLTPQARASAMEIMFGSDAVRAANVLYDQGAKGIDKWRKEVDDAGYAARQAGTRLDNLKGDLEELGGALETAFIGAGSGASQGILRDVVQGTTDVVNAFNGLPPAAQESTTAVLAMTAGLGGTVWAGSKAIETYVGVKETFDNLGVSMTGANKKMLAMRGGAAALGVAAVSLSRFADESTATGEAIESLGTVAGGTLMGFAVGGPIGAAIGGGATALWEIGHAAFGSGEKVVESKPKYEGLADTLDQVSGAATKATRELVLLGLQESGAADAANYFGIAMRDLVSAALGQEDAVKRVNQALGDQVTVQDAVMAASLKGVIGEVTDEYREQRKEIRENNAATATWGELLAGMPKAVRVELKNMGYKATREEILELRDQYDLTPKQVRTLMRVLGVQDAKRDTASVQGPLNVLDAFEARPSIQLVGAESALFQIGRLRSAMSGLGALSPLANVQIPAQRRASGGQIVGPGTATSDSIPAMLSDGEYVIRAAAVDHYGVGFFDMANAMHLAKGGLASTDQAFYTLAAGGPVPSARKLLEAAR